MTEQEQIDALKAQVNCLREAALYAISFMVGGEAKAKLRDAYDATPEQCLAEVKANAIEDMLEVGYNQNQIAHNDTTSIKKALSVSYISWYINKLREQAK